MGHPSPFFTQSMPSASQSRRLGWCRPQTKSWRRHQTALGLLVNSVYIASDALSMCQYVMPRVLLFCAFTQLLTITQLRRAPEPLQCSQVRNELLNIRCRPIVHTSPYTDDTRQTEQQLHQVIELSSTDTDSL